MDGEKEDEEGLHKVMGRGKSEKEREKRRKW